MYLSNCLIVYLSIYLSILSYFILSHLILSHPIPSYPIYRSVPMSVCLSVCLLVCLSFYLSICLSFCLSVLMSFYSSLYLFNLSTCLSVNLSICLSIVYVSICLFSLHVSVCLWIFLSTWKNAIMRHVLQKWKLTCPNRHISARLLQKMKVQSFETTKFCEISLLLEVDNIKKETILRDFLQN